MKHWYLDDLADDLWIDQNHMPLNSRPKDNATILILHNLQMNVELFDQSGEYNVGVIVQVALVICLNNLIDNVQGSNHNITPDYIPLWIDQPVGNFGSGSSTTFLCQTLR
jgi:hypothetical protein